MLKGAFTALVTPFNGEVIDYEGLDMLTEFQIENGISGILAVGTTGESPVLTWEEHNKIIEKIAENAKGKCLCIAGTGSNNTAECISATRHAAEVGVDAVLLVDGLWFVIRLHFTVNAYRSFTKENMSSRSSMTFWKAGLSVSRSR